MGRPEKAKVRKLTGSPNILFPVGKEGGRLRSVYEAVKVGRVRADFPNYYCEKCKLETIYPICENCGTNLEIKCIIAENVIKNLLAPCEEHKNSTTYSNKILDIKHYFQKSKEKLAMKDYEMPALIKGVRGLSSANKQIENLAKGILRAKYNLQVNKDGTIRFDATELPLLHLNQKKFQ